MSRHGPNPVAPVSRRTIASLGQRQSSKGWIGLPSHARTVRFAYRGSMPGVRYAVLLMALLVAGCGRVTDSEQVRLCRAVIPVLNGAGAEIREIRVGPALLSRSGVRIDYTAREAG